MVALLLRTVACGTTEHAEIRTFSSETNTWTAGAKRVSLSREVCPLCDQQLEAESSSFILSHYCSSYPRACTKRKK